MTFKIAEVVLASAVASAGTFVVTYPTDTTAGDYAAYGHIMFARGLQAKFSQDAGTMSVSFGASDITVTYSGSTTIPAGTTVTVQLNKRGADDAKNPQYLTDMKRMSFLSPVRIDLGAPDTADADGIVESQDLTTAEVYSVLAFNGVYGDPYSNDYAVLDVPRNVVAAWTTTAVLTVYGEDEYGNEMIESSGSGTTMTGKKAFKKVTRIDTSANITSLTVGTGDVLGLPVYVDKIGRIIGEFKDDVLIPNIGGKIVYLQGLALEAAVDAGTGLNFVSPVAGFVRKVSTIAQTGITTGGAVTAEIATVAINGLSVTIANSSSEGDVDSDTPTKDHATTAVAVGDRIEVQFDAALNASSDLMIVIEIEATYALDGTFAAGVQTAATATTGDVRGTYDPSTACTGAISFALLALLPDPTYKGVNQYDG